MPQEPINFGPNQESSYDELGGASPSAINVIIDEKGTVYKRPGIATYSVAPSSVVDGNGIIGTSEGVSFFGHLTKAKLIPGDYSQTYHPSAHLIL